MSEFEALRSDLAAVRSDGDRRFTGLAGRIATLGPGLARVGARPGGTPGPAVIHQAAPAIVAGTLAMLKTTSLLP